MQIVSDMIFSARFFKTVFVRLFAVFTLGIVLIIVSENVPRETDYYEFYHRENSLPRQDHHQGPNNVTKEASGPIKVLLVTYMRGGSTFLGELFNQNKDACYWYEPIEGMYHAMYGFLPVLQPLDLLYFTNETKRHQSRYEKDTIYKYLHRLFTDADIGKYPVELLYSRVVLDRHIRWTNPLRGCLRPRFGVKMNWIMTFKRRHCHQCLPEPKLHDVVTCHKDDITSDNLSRCPMKKVECHKECMNLIRNKTAPCLRNVHKLCSNKNISAVKVVRLTNEMVTDILTKDPTVKVIYYTRDPRAVFVSRKEAGKWMHSNVSKRKWIKEIQLLCKRMLEDYQNFQKLKFLYPNNVLSMTYESFAQEPIKYANEVYKLIGKPVPLEVEKWLRQNTMATKDTGDFDTTRRNSTATAFAWRNKITLEQVTQINSGCKEVLNIVGYPLDIQVTAN